MQGTINRQNTPEGTRWSSQKGLFGLGGAGGNGKPMESMIAVQKSLWLKGDAFS